LQMFAECIVSRASKSVVQLFKGSKNWLLRAANRSDLHAGHLFVMRVASNN
jgi:hypothetical protein